MLLILLLINFHVICISEDVRNVINSSNENVDQTGKPVSSQVKIHTNFKRSVIYIWFL